MFVRLTACDLRCSWCDTPYAFHEGRKMSVDEVVAAVERHGCPLVEITGGEPLLQDDVYPLMDRLLAAGRRVMLETGGHRSDCAGAAGGPQDRRRQVSRQRRSRQERLGEPRPAGAARRSEVRHSRTAATTSSRRTSSRGTRSARAPRPFCCRPSTASSSRATLSEWILADRLPARLQLQLHKFIWSPSTQRRLNWVNLDDWVIW